MARTVEKMRKSEARIMIYLSQVGSADCYAYLMSDKLHMDYIYLTRILNEMFNKKWIAVSYLNGRRYFTKTIIAPLHLAKERLQ